MGTLWANRWPVGQVKADELIVGFSTGMETPDLRDLSGRFPHNGRVEAIFLRPQRRGEVQPVDQALAIATCGLAGDHYATPRAIAWREARGKSP